MLFLGFISGKRIQFPGKWAKTSKNPGSLTSTQFGIVIHHIYMHAIYLLLARTRRCVFVFCHAVLYSFGTRSAERALVPEPKPAMIGTHYTDCSLVRMLGKLVFPTS